MADKIKELLEKNGQMIIDGSMSTALEQMGANLNCNLWTARALVDTPELVKKVHTDYFKAGADCGITCSYQATIPGLMENGFTHDEAAEIVANSVKLFLEAREEWWNAEGKAQGRVYPLCLAGIGLTAHILRMVRNTAGIMAYPMKPCVHFIRKEWRFSGTQAQIFS